MVQQKFVKRLERVAELLDEAADLLDEINGEMQDRLGEASERWLESEAGEEYQGYAELIENAFDAVGSSRDEINGII